jgi:hypothetical protein
MPIGPESLDVLVPTKDRPGALAITLAGLAAQTVSGFRVVVSDQSDGGPAWDQPQVSPVTRILAQRGATLRKCRHLPRRGMAEHRRFLLSQSPAPYVLFLDDDVWLEPHAVDRLLTAMGQLRCGFVGMAVQGLSYLSDLRPHEHSQYEEWSGGVRPERVRRGEPEWERWRLHNAANLIHLADELGLRDDEWRAYKVAWIGACVLYDRAKLLDCGGFDFWAGLPAQHAGEDVVAQLRVMERYGGAGIIPSAAIHLEFPTTIPDRLAHCYDFALASPGAGPPGGVA